MLGAGREGLNIPSAAAIEAVGQQVRSPASKMIAEQVAWPALIRKLDRINTGYRD